MSIKKALCLLLCTAMAASLFTACASDAPVETQPPAPSSEAAPQEESTLTPEVSEEIVPDTDHEAIVAALNIDESAKPELVRASEAGFSMELAAQATISGAELAVLLDNFVEIAAAERLTDWQSQYPMFRVANEPLQRLDAMAAITLAAQFVGGTYEKVNTSPWPAAEKLQQSWDKDYLTWALFGGFEPNSQIDVGVTLEPSPLDGQAYFYALGRISLISGQTLFVPNADFSSMRIEDNCTYAEALLALIRLIDSDIKNIETPEDIRPELLSEAVSLGITDQSMADRAGEIITRGEMTEILANVRKLRLNSESRYLSDISAILPENEADRLWFATAIFYSDLEYTLGLPYEGWLQWMQTVPDYESSNRSYFSPDGGLDTTLLSDGYAGEASIFELCPDATLINGYPPEGMEALEQDKRRFDLAFSYATSAMDHYTGEKVLKLNGVNYAAADTKMTIGETIQAAFRYYYYLESPEKISCGEMGDFDSSVITLELLSKETSLPEASCAELPASWKGTMFADWIHSNPQARSAKRDKVIMEGDLDALKEAGFNFIGFAVDFAWLQGIDAEEGKFSKERIDRLDQVIAWCIEKDIHIDLRISGVGDTPYTMELSDWFDYQVAAVNGTEHIDSFAAYWGALARRYKDIPNSYLSFNLMIEPGPESEETYVRFFGPAVEAIREHSPERCIIADIHNGVLTGEGMAKLGVALSYHQYDPREFCTLTDAECMDKEYLASVSWPFNGIDAEATMTMPMFGQENATNVLKMQQLAKDNGVGFMVGEFGIFDEFAGKLTKYRYSDETVEAFYTDMTATFEKYSIGWCNSSYYNCCGILFGYPSVESSDFSTRENTDNYVDNKMMALWQEINGVK